MRPIAARTWNALGEARFNPRDSVRLIALGAATHSFDQNQRFVPLEFSGSLQGALTVSPPTQWNIAPRAYYMLFILTPGDRPGIFYPSVARLVQLKIPSLPGG